MTTAALTQMSKKIHDPLGDGISAVELIQHVGSDEIVAACARVSLGNDLDSRSSEDNRKLIKFLLKAEHGSPLEHNLITFRVKAPLYVIQEMLRHRHLSFNQESHRYLSLGEKVALEFYQPPEFRGQSKSNRQASVGVLDNPELAIIYSKALDLAAQTYQHLLDRGVARELARGLLPHCTYSSLYVTFNLRSLMHFLELRLADGAQLEIRRYAEAFLEIAAPLFPITFDVWKELQVPTTK